jgi:hypothetical protein
MPQIHAVGDAAEVRERWRGKDALDETAASVLERGDQDHGQRGHQYSTFDRIEGNRRGGKDEQKRDRHRRHAESDAAAPRPQSEKLRSQCQTGAGKQLIRTRVGSVICAVDIRRRNMQGHESRSHAAQHDDRAQHPPPTATGACGQDEHGGQEHGPHEIELLLDGQGPEMQNRIGVDVRGEIVGALANEVPVRDIYERRPKST